MRFIESFEDVNPFAESYTEDANLFVVYVTDDKKVIWKMIKDTDRKAYNATNKSAIAPYFPNKTIDRPYTLIAAVEAQEVELKLLEQYGSMYDLISVYGQCK